MLFRSGTQNNHLVPPRSSVLDFIVHFVDIRFLLPFFFACFLPCFPYFRHDLDRNTPYSPFVTINNLQKMIIDAKTIVLTLIVVTVSFYCGLQLVRSFALQIAQENHDANVALDEAESAKRLKREQQADSAAASAYAKVEPLLVTVATTTTTKATAQEIDPGVGI